MKGLLLISHGSLAKGMYESTEWFFGNEMPQVDYCCLMFEDNVDDYSNRLMEKIDKLNDGDGVVVMCDLFGGSPFKSALLCMAQRGDIKLITGLNLPMVMEFLGKRLSDEYDFEAVVKQAQEGIVDFQLDAQQSEDDE